MWVSTSHIADEFDFGCCMLVGVAVRAVRAVSQGADSAVVLFSPPVNVLAAGFITECCLCDSVFERIFNYCLLKPHILCYLIHSE